MSLKVTQGHPNWCYLIANISPPVVSSNTLKRLHLAPFPRYYIYTQCVCACVLEKSFIARATLASAGISRRRVPVYVVCVSVCLCVCLLHACIVSKRLSVGSRKNATDSPGTLVF